MALGFQHDCYYSAMSSEPLCTTELHDWVLGLIRERGVERLTINLILQLLQSQHGVDITRHRADVREIVFSLLKTNDEVQRMLADFMRQREEEARPRSKGPRAKRQRSDAATKAKLKEKEPAEKGKRRRKKEKRENPVKRPTSSFFFFVKQERAKVVEELGKVSFGVVTRKLGDLWEQLSEAEKAPYIDLAKQDKQRYHDERARAGIAVKSKDQKAEKSKRKQKNESLSSRESSASSSGASTASTRGSSESSLTDGASA